jgi:hypothetical protein
VVGQPPALLEVDADGEAEEEADDRDDEEADAGHDQAGDDRPPGDAGVAQAAPGDQPLHDLGAADEQRRDGQHRPPRRRADRERPHRDRRPHEQRPGKHRDHDAGDARGDREADDDVSKIAHVAGSAAVGVAASANGLPSESRHIAQRSPGWMTDPPSSRTRWSVAVMSATVK